MTQLGNFVWSIADQLRGVYKPAQYGSVVLPFTILRRMECVLDAHRDEIAPLIRATTNDQALGAKLRRDYDLHFWNRSNHTLKSLLGNPDALADGLIEYTSSFSFHVADIFERYGFAKTLTKLDENNRLYLVVQQFAEADMHPATLDNAAMGDVFEDLIRRFAEASNETAGEHFTPRDAIKLMVDVLLATDTEMLTQPGTVRAIYDPTALRDAVTLAVVETDDAHSRMAELFHAKAGVEIALVEALGRLFYHDLHKPKEDSTRADFGFDKPADVTPAKREGSGRLNSQRGETVDRR